MQNGSIAQTIGPAPNDTTAFRVSVKRREFLLTPGKARELGEHVLEDEALVDVAAA